MRVVCFDSLDALTPHADAWDRLADGIPFRTWTWLSLWWRHYGPQTEAESRRRRLAVLGVFDDAGTLMAVAPWYLDCSAIHGRVLRPLGSGEVCSDYMGVLCHPSAEEAAISGITDYLVEQSLSHDSNALRWDLLELDCVDAKDRIVRSLADALAVAGCIVHCRPDVNCWRIKLPVTWEMYVASLGRNERRDVRRMEREYISVGRTIFHSAERLDQLPGALDILVRLHAKRREMLGESGRFASERFLGFHRDVIAEFLRTGQAELHWLEVDGRIVAAEYQLSGDGVLYAYQSGVEPDAMACQPGKLLYLSILRRAIERGYRAFDFLRGDEPYKARFGAHPQPTVEYRIVPCRAVAKFRHGIWLAGVELKTWVKEAIGESS